MSNNSRSKNARMRRAALLSAAGLSLAFGVAGGAAPAMAQQAGADARMSFNIPAGSVRDALQAFAAQTNLQLVYGADLDAQTVSPGVTGQMTAAEALARLLAGTGLTFRFANDRTVTIESAGGSGGERVLGAVRVQGAQNSGLAGSTPVNGVNGSRDVTATEGTGSYTSNALTVGSKVAATIKDTPMAVSVITNQQIQDRNMTNLSSAMRDTPGVTVLTTNATDSAFYSRGFLINQIQIDGGAPQNTTSQISGVAYNPIIDMSLYDHVELVRGATGTFNAYGNPGGVINLVRKRPLDRAQMLFELQGGSWDWHRVSADITGPLAFGGKLRGRLIATHQDNNYFYRVVHTERDLVSGTLEYDLTPTTLVTAGVNYSVQNGTAWGSGLPRFTDGTSLGLPRSTALTIADARNNSSSFDYFGQIEQKIGAEWTLKLKGTRSAQRMVQDAAGVFSAGVDPISHIGAYLPTPFRYYSNPKQTQLEATLDGTFRLFGQDQKILVGANYSMSDFGDTASFQNDSFNANVEYVGKVKTSGRYLVDVFHFDPYSWVLSSNAYSVQTAGFDYADSRVLNSYINFDLSPISGLHVEGSLRYSSTRSRALGWQYCSQVRANVGSCGPVGSKYYLPSQYGGQGGQLVKGHDFSWPPSVSIRYDAGKSFTAYATYADIYQNRSGQLDINRRPLPPITGMNFEGGIKWLSRNQKLNANLSVFYTRQSRTATYSVCDDDPTTATPDCTFPTQNITGLAPQTFCCSAVDPLSYNLSYGADLEISGEIRRGWQIAASYTYNINRNESPNAKYFDGSSQALESQSPKNIFKIWSTYDFEDGSIFRGVRVGLGANGQSRTFVSGYRCNQQYFSNGVPIFCLQSVRVFISNPGYVIFDGSLGYKISDKLRLDVELENLFDKTYYARISTYEAGNWYGTPRSVKATLRAKF